MVVGAEDLRAELVRGQPLPRIELEAGADEAELLVHEPAGQAVPADLLDGERLGVQAGLFGGLLEVGDRHQVLAELVGLGVREVQRAGREQLGLAPPGVDEALVEGVPLVGAGEAFLHPEPLRTGRLHEGGGRVGVVLQHLGRAAAAVVAQVEPTVEGGLFGASSPGLGDQRGQLRVGDAEVGEAVVLDDVRGRGQAHGVQLLDDVLQGLHLGEREGVVRALVPVGAQGVVGVAGQGIDHPLLLDGLLPVGTGLDGVPLHGGGQPPLEPELEWPPMPPRVTADLSKLPPETLPAAT